VSTLGPLFAYGYRARARNTDPVESHDAAAKVNVAKREQQVLDALDVGVELTTHEIAELTGIPLVSVSPRMVKLEAKGLVGRMGRRCGRTTWGRI
jgi:uncharacterized membrane protein